MPDSLWWEECSEGRRLTVTAEAIYRDVRTFLSAYRRAAQINDESLEQRAEANFLATLLDGAPVDLEALREIVKPRAAALRAWIDAPRADRPPDLTTWLQTCSDEEVLRLIRENSRWVEVPAVAARIAERLGAEAKVHTAFARQLGNVSDARHRPATVTPDAVRLGFDTCRANAIAIAAAWTTVVERHPDDPLLELGRHLREELEGASERRVLQSGVRDYLVGLCAVVADRDGRRPVTLADPGWPTAVAYAFTSAHFDITASYVAKLRKPTRK